MEPSQCKMYMSKLQKCIHLNCKMYLSEDQMLHHWSAGSWPDKEASAVVEPGRCSSSSAVRGSTVQPVGIPHEESKCTYLWFRCFQKDSLPYVSRASCHLISTLLTSQCSALYTAADKDWEMSKQHEGFRFWENLEKKSGSQDSTPRLNLQYIRML